MIKIGITGGIGSGKTTICKIFESLGISIYYADDRAKLLMRSNQLLKSQIKALLGSEAYHRNGRLNRAYVASKVFTDKLLLSQLNSIVHPAVARDFDTWSIAQSSAYVIKEAALLIESKSYQQLDKLILVTADEEVRIGRVMKRDRVSRQAVLARIQNQMTDAAKKPFADYVIDNSGSHSLVLQVVDIHRKLMNLKDL